MHNVADAELEGGAEILPTTTWIFDDDAGRGITITTSEIVETLQGSQQAAFGVFMTVGKSPSGYLRHKVDGTATAYNDYFGFLFIKSQLDGQRARASPQFFTVDILCDFDIRGSDTFLLEVKTHSSSIPSFGGATIQDTPPMREVVPSVHDSTGTPSGGRIPLLQGQRGFAAGEGDDIMLDNCDSTRIFSEVSVGSRDCGSNGGYTRLDGLGNDILGGKAGNNMLEGRAMSSGTVWELMRFATRCSIVRITRPEVWALG